MRIFVYMLKAGRVKIFVAISSLALLSVLIIQINWIQESAKTKEKIFEEKVTILRARTTEALSSLGKDIFYPQDGVSIREHDIIDSLLQQNMKYYNFHPSCTFNIVLNPSPYPFPLPYKNEDTNSEDTTPVACGKISLDKNIKLNGWELKLFFPEKEEFLTSEMLIPLITSFVLIIIVLFLFWQTIKSLIKEKRISEHTTDFLNNMTHEFKTPLTNIALAGKMINKEAGNKQEEKTKHYSSIILEENEKLRLQVEQVLSMTALERGEIPLQKTETDIHQLIKDTLKSISLQIENKQGSLQLNLKADDVVIMADKTHLNNAICNLIDNAIKYAKERPEISISTFNKEKNIVLRIEDKGIGIEKQYQKKVFGKFFRVPTGNMHNVKGFGLGLAYVKKIVELHAGSIELDSEKEKGTTFIITLPNA